MEERKEGREGGSMGGVRKKEIERKRERRSQRKRKNGGKEKRKRV